MSYLVRFGDFQAAEELFLRGLGAGGGGRSTQRGGGLRGNLEPH